jgi:signal recognition particle subunit SRP19
MAHPRVEEVSDSDLSDPSDPSEGNISDFDDADILRRVDAPSSSKSSNAPQRPSAARPAPRAPSAAATAGAGRGGGGTIYKDPGEAKEYNNFQCLYPVYFDASRTRTEGRRVASTLAVKNPLARDIAQACSHLGLQVVLEPHKFHPKDWANPGRVRVRLEGGSAPSSPPVRNKHHLFVLVGRYLTANPTAEDSPALRMTVPGVPLPVEDGKPWPRPAVPRGWKMGDLLPALSPAMTGGGISEGMFREMMKEMGPGGDAMAALMGAGAEEKEPKEKKEKKGKKGKGKA